MTSSISTAHERVDALIRVISLVCIIMGAVFVYFISQTTLIPQLIPIFYFMAGLLIFAGATMLIAKYE